MFAYVVFQKFPDGTQEPYRFVENLEEAEMLAGRLREATVGVKILERVKGGSGWQLVPEPTSEQSRT